MKFNLKKMAIFIPAILFLSVYFAGLIVQYRIYFKNMLQIGITEEAEKQINITMNPINVFTYAFDDVYGIYVILGVIALIGLGLLKIALGYIKVGTLDKERNFSYADSGTYGTAGWLSEKEIKKVANVENWKNTKGVILGQLDKTGNKIISTKSESRMNKHVAVFGASGTGKSRCYSRNYIIQAAERKESIIVTDPKGELFEDTAEFLRNNGYIVKIYNLVNPEKSDSWNCLKEIRGEELRAQLFANTIISNTSTGKGDHFWDNSEMNLLKALVLRVERGEVFRRDNNQNMGTVYELLTNLGEGKLDKLFNPSMMTKEEKVAIAPYQIFKQAGEAVRGGIILGLGTRLQVFQNEDIRKITEEDDIDLELPGKRPCAYFCIMSDQDSTLNFLSSLFFSFLFIDLVRYAGLNGGKCDVPVNFILDEFPNIGKIVDFEKKISTVRSRDINISVIFQAVSQLENRYPKGLWEEIIGNCDTHLFLGCNDQKTAEFISARSGEITINVNSIQANKSSRLNPLYSHGQKESFGEGKRMLLTKDEVLRMHPDECLIIFRGQNPIKALKYDYSNHPKSKEFVKTYIRDYPSIYDTEQRELIKERERILTGRQINVDADEIEILTDDVAAEDIEVIDLSSQEIEIEIINDETSKQSEILNEDQKEKDTTEPKTNPLILPLEEDEEEEGTQRKSNRSTPARMLYGREIGSSSTDVLNGNLSFEEVKGIPEENEDTESENIVDSDALNIESILKYQAETANSHKKRRKMGIDMDVNIDFEEVEAPTVEEDFVPAGVTNDGLALKKRNS